MKVISRFNNAFVGHLGDFFNFIIPLTKWSKEGWSDNKHKASCDTVRQTHIAFTIVANCLQISDPSLTEMEKQHCNIHDEQLYLLQCCV